VGWDTLNGSAPDVELSYRLLSPEHAGKGTATEAVRLLASWLFGSQHMNRLMLYIHVDNIGSRRVAEKTGFTKEGTARQAWYHQGSWHDVDIYAMTRSDFEGLH
jgi:RimJ/RimL family protein N-acetyltransferase